MIRNWKSVMHYIVTWDNAIYWQWLWCIILMAVPSYYGPILFPNMQWIYTDCPFSFWWSPILSNGEVLIINLRAIVGCIGKPSLKKAELLITCRSSIIDACMTSFTCMVFCSKIITEDQYYMAFEVIMATTHCMSSLISRCNHYNEMYCSSSS